MTDSLDAVDVCNAPREGETRRCLLCGVAFPARLSTHVYCSRDCARRSERAKRRRHAEERARRRQVRGRECGVCKIRDSEAGVWSGVATLCAACDRRLQRNGGACGACGWEGGLTLPPGAPRAVCPRCYPAGLVAIDL